MSAIFSNALSGIKSNPKASTNQNLLANQNKVKTIAKNTNGTSDDKKTDIFSRLKQSNNKKATRLLHDKVYKDEHKDYDVQKVHRKTISKDLTSRLGRNQRQHEPDDEEQKGDGSWKHDKYRDGPVTSEATVACTIFIRNLPDQIDSDTLKSLLKESTSIIGHSIERGTAEVVFSSRAAATKAISNIHGRVYQGNTIKAALVSELNEGMIKVRDKSKDMIEEDGRVPISGRKYSNEFISKMTIDLSKPSTGKGSSILDRIKKR